MDRTNDPRIAAFLWARGFPLKGIEGPRGRKTFIFCEPIPDEVVSAFIGSPEKKVLDRHHRLKQILATTP